jgi:hypothetical protein
MIELIDNFVSQFIFKMEYIGKRISIKKDDKGMSIVILSTADKIKKILLVGWFFLWTLCGVIVLSQYFLIQDQQTRAALIVWLGFWAYFEYKTFKAVMWRSFGVEKIKLRDGKFLYKKDVSGKGKINTYNFDFIKDLRIIEQKDNSFFENLNNSYWVIAGEKIAFDYEGKEVKFALQLDEVDTKALFKVIKTQIK